MKAILVDALIFAICLTCFSSVVKATEFKQPDSLKIVSSEACDSGELCAMDEASKLRLVISKTSYNVISPLGQKSALNIVTDTDSHTLVALLKGSSRRCPVSLKVNSETGLILRVTPTCGGGIE